MRVVRRADLRIDYWRRAHIDRRFVRLWEESLLRVDRHLLKCVVYLYQDAPNAEDSVGEGATGFAICASAQDGNLVFIVSNRHVIEDGCTTIRLNMPDGGFSILETEETDWFYSSDNNIDCAIYWLRQPNQYDILPLGLDMMTMREDIEDIDITIGDDVVLLGRFINFEGKVQNTPTARFGKIVQMPTEPLLDERGRLTPCWLAQIPSIPGMSGSPVILKQSYAEFALFANEQSAGISMIPPRPIMLLGINCGHLLQTSPIYYKKTKAENLDIVSSYNTSVNQVLPAW